MRFVSTKNINNVYRMSYYFLPLSTQVLALSQVGSAKLNGLIKT